MPASVETPTEAAPETALPSAIESVLPESVRSAVQPPDIGSVVDQFFKEPAAAPKPAAPAPKPAESVAPKPTEPAVKPKTETVAERLAARAAKPKVPAENADPKKEEAKPGDAPKPEGTDPAKEPEAPKNPEDEINLDPKAHPATAENFKKLRTITKGVRDQLITKDREVQELKSKLQAASVAPTTAQLQELEKLRAEHKALSDRLLVLDTQNHPKFQEQFVLPKQAALAATKELLEASGVKDADLAKLIDLPRGELGKAVAQLTKDLPDLDRSEVASNILQAWQLNEAGRAALKQANQTHSSIRQRTEIEQKQLFESRWGETVKDAAPVKLEIPADAAPEVRAEYEAFNADVEAIRTRAEQIALTPLTEEQVADHAIKSSAYDFHLKHVQPQLLKAIEARNETIARLTSELEKYRSRNPNRDIRPTPTDAGNATPAKTANSIEELADSMYPNR